jgi:D-arabinose 1-dehydrogenase-like Zn-dependent alcohol dehydrogenase
MKVNSRYISCGYYDQLNLAQLGEFKYVGKSINELMAECIIKNISIIGNCLGHKSHLEQAIEEYQKGNFNIPIDSVITGNDIAYFFDRTFNDPDRIGKVVYKYND